VDQYVLVAYYNKRLKAKHAMLSLSYEGIWRNEGTAPLFLTSAVDGVEWLGLRRCCFTPKNRAPFDRMPGAPYSLCGCVEKRRCNGN
jgi:hypothetical protein